MTIRRFLGPLRGRKVGFGYDQSGASAVEFALIAPLIFFSLLAMVDVGFAVNDRMYVDQILRSGGQPAMRDRGEAIVEETLKRAACKGGETYPNCTNIAKMTFAVDRYCVCPVTEVRDPTCTDTCEIRPQTFYKVSATKTYEGIFLPQFNFVPSKIVEVR